MRFIKWSFLALLLLANISLFAEDDVALLWKKKANDQNIEQTQQRVIPELAPRECPTDQGMFLTLDFLYWSAQNRGFPWGAKNNDNTTSLPTDTSTLHINTDWDPGFKLGIGWDTLHDYWDILAKWNYYYNHSKDSASAPDAILDPAGTGPFGGIFSFAGFNAGVVYKDSKVQWRLKYNMFDLEIGRVFYISNNLSLRTHAGARGGWLNQVFRISYSDALLEGPGNLLRDDVFHANNDFWGIGPRVGIDGDWHLGSGFSVFGNIAAALLYGKFNLHEKERFLLGANWPDFPHLVPGIFNDLVGIKHSFTELTPNIQLLIGLAWSKCFNSDKTFFSIKAGWETNYWWNQYHLRPLIINLPMLAKENHPVEMQGLTVCTKVDF